MKSRLSGDGSEPHFDVPVNRNAPFTIQRICELCIRPQDHYKAVGKYLRAVEKTLLVTSTWDSFPKRPLPGRTNIVITRDKGWTAEGAVTVHSLDEALARARIENPSEIAVIGGGDIYKAALPLATRVELTEVHTDATGDTHLPRFDPATWRETAREDRATPEGLRYSYVTLVR